MIEQKVLVTWQDEQGLPRAYACGPLAELDSVREAARFHKDAYLVERACFGDDVDLSESMRLLC